jgi:hypothetical protein
MTRTSPPDTPAPQDIERAVRAAAQALPPSSGDITRVRARARGRRRRRTTAQLAVAAVLVTLVLVGVPTVGRFWSHASGPSPAASVLPTFSVAPGRILLDVRQRPFPGRDRLSVIAAVNVDGTLAQVPKPHGFQTTLQQATTPDGRIVVIGTTITTDELTLAVLASDGTVTMTRKLAGRPDGSVTLSAVTNNDVFLNRGTVFVAHNIATGAERELRRYQPGSVPNVIIAHANADAVVVAPADQGETSCGAALLDPKTGRQIRVITAPLSMCPAFDVRLSPDGRYLAMLVPISPNGSDTRLFIMDVATGTAVREFAAPVAKGPGIGFFFSGWGWSGPTTVRIVKAHRPTEDIAGLADVLQISTFPV